MYKTSYINNTTIVTQLFGLILNSVKLHKYVILLLFILFSFSTSLLSQETGNTRLKIIDRETGLSVMNVKVKYDSDKILYSDTNGVVNITSPIGKLKIEISRLGYRNKSEWINISDEMRLLRIFLEPEGIKSPNVIVTGHQYQSDFDRIGGDNYSMEGSELKRNTHQTISESIADMTGVTLQTMGNATARPVIRGFGGNRIETQMNESIIADMSASSSDHAVTPSVSSAKKIEILRGVEALKRSGNSSIGLIKITGNQIPVEKFEQPKVEATLLAETVNAGYSSSIAGDFTYGNFGFHGDAAYRKHNDMLTPKGKLENSQGSAGNFSLGSSYITDDFVTGGSFTSLNNSYSVPGGVVGAHPNGVNIDMVYKNINLRSIIHLHNDLFDNIDINFSRTYYHHKEYEYSGILGAEYKLEDYIANIDFSKKSEDFKNNIDFGMSMNHKDYTPGAFVFTPQTNHFNAGLYYIQKLEFEKCSLQYGARTQFHKFSPDLEYLTKTGGIGKESEFLLFSASISGSYRMTDRITLLLLLGRNNRAPSIEELYSQGPHLASYTYEVGNTNLPVEKSNSIELSSDFRFDFGNLFVTGYIYDYSSFIAFRNSGDTNWAQFLPIFKSEDIQARIIGGEANLTINILRTLQFNTGISINYGQNLSDNLPLPFFSPSFGSLGLVYQLNGFSLGLSGKYSFAQNRTDIYEKPTDGFIIFGIFSEYKFKWGNTFHDLTLSLDNAGNQIYYNHLSRLKDIIPESGRNLRLVYRFYY